jgi:hypothetical protein
LLKEYWPQALADDWGGIYALQDEILPKMIESNGGTMEGLNTSIESFNPKHDNRLHNYYTKRLKKAFNPEYAETLSEIEQENDKQAGTKDDFINRVNADVLSDRTYKAIKHTRTHGRI